MNDNMCCVSDGTRFYTINKKVWNLQFSKLKEQHFIPRSEYNIDIYFYTKDDILEVSSNIIKMFSLDPDIFRAEHIYTNFNMATSCSTIPKYKHLF